MECAIKWFSIKGNTKCDLCSKNVADLPVTLVRVPNGAQRDINRPSIVEQLNSEVEMDRLHNIYILVWFSKS
jgi:hypothetical protein